MHRKDELASIFHGLWGSSGFGMPIHAYFFQRKVGQGDLVLVCGEGPAVNQRVQDYKPLSTVVDKKISF